MPKRYRVKLSKEEFDNGKVPSNHVIVELLRVEEDAVTHGGIAMGMYEDDTWEDEEETHPADIASVVGIVRKVPEYLTFGERDGDMPWETDMELREGDTVWFNMLESKNANEIVVDKKVLRALPYRDIYVSKRIARYSWDGIPEYEVIMLNGFVLLEQIPIPKMSELDYLDHGVYVDRGKVRYFGKPNKRYTNPMYNDSLPIKEGDTVFIQAGYVPFPLERRAYFSIFEKNKLFYVIQRRRLIFAI